MLNSVSQLIPQKTPTGDSFPPPPPPPATSGAAAIEEEGRRRRRTANVYPPRSHAKASSSSFLLLHFFFRLPTPTSRFQSPPLLPLLLPTFLSSPRGSTAATATKGGGRERERGKLHRLNIQSWHFGKGKHGRRTLSPSLSASSSGLSRARF